MALIRPIPSGKFAATLVASEQTFINGATGSVSASNIPAGTYLVTVMAAGNPSNLPTISVTNGTATLLNSITDPTYSKLYTSTYLVTLTSSDTITANYAGGDTSTRITLALEIYK